MPSGIFLTYGFDRAALHLHLYYCSRIQSRSKWPFHFVDKNKAIMVLMYVGADGRLNALLENLRIEIKDCEFVRERDGKKAVARILEMEDISLIILIDRDLENINCVALLRFVKSRSNLFYTRAIIISPYFSTHERKLYQRQGADLLLSLDSNLQKTKNTIIETIGALDKTKLDRYPDKSK